MVQDFKSGRLLVESEANPVGDGKNPIDVEEIVRGE